MGSGGIESIAFLLFLKQFLYDESKEKEIKTGYKKK